MAQSKRQTDSYAKTQEKENRTDRTVTRAYLGEVIHRNIGLSRNGAMYFVDDLLQEMSQALVTDKHLKISSFGTFNVQHKKSRIGRNPKTGEPALISARRVLSFRASNVLTKRMNRETK